MGCPRVQGYGEQVLLALLTRVSVRTQYCYGKSVRPSLSYSADILSKRKHISPILDTEYKVWSVDKWREFIYLFVIHQSR